MTTPATIYAAIGAAATTAESAAGAAPVSGPRNTIPFAFINIAAGDNANPLLSTPVAGLYCGVATIPAGVAMIRPGSLTAIAVQCSEAAAGSNAVFGVYKNGTIINTGAIATVASATSMTKGGSIFPAGGYTFVAGDVLDVRIRTGSGWTAAACDANVIVEIETLT